MARILLLPFAVLLLLGAFALGAYGVSLLVDDGGEASGEGAFIDGRFFGSAEGGADKQEALTVRAVSLIGFGILAAIMGVVLAALAVGGRDASSQQQQVVVVTDPDARVETRRAP